MAPLRWADMPKLNLTRKVPMQLLYECRVYDKNWKLKKTTGLRNSHCFLLNFFRYLESSYNHSHMGSGYGPIGVGTDGVSHGISVVYDGSLANLQVGYRSAVCAMATDDTYGLLVGTGTTPVAPGDYMMETQLTHGVSANTLYHYNTSETGAVSSEASCWLTCQRVFGNVSGSEINITEMGLQYVGYFAGGQNDSWRLFILHDIIDVSVSDTDFLTCLYLLKTTT